VPFRRRMEVRERLCSSADIAISSRHQPVAPHGRLRSGFAVHVLWIIAVIFFVLAGWTGFERRQEVRRRRK
jgi:hypothetical protein